MAELAPGTVFAGFTIERMLGTGGMGSVYQAAHPRIPRRIALKLLHQSLTHDRLTTRLFEQEADHAARLDHANIVSVLDRGSEGEQLWIAMQYISGDNAATAIRQGRIGPQQAIHIITEIAKALDYAHENGVLHRDVKPANILLEDAKAGAYGRVMLADFGIAKALTESVNRTRTGKLVASLQFAAPEQFEDTPLDRRADIYSLGATLYNLLTGKAPYAGSSLPQLMRAHLHDPAPLPSQAMPDLPRGLDAVVARAMAKKPADRYDTCTDLARAAAAAFSAPRVAPQTYAETHVETYPEARPQAGQAQRFGSAPSAGPAPSAGGAPPADPRAGNRVRWWIAGGAAAAIAAVVLTATILLSGWGSEAEAPATPAAPSTTMLGADGATYTISGELLQKYQTLDTAEKSDLGPPLGAEKTNPDGKYQWFVGGVIIAKSGGAPHIVWGEIRKKWNELGGSQGSLGYPTSDEIDLGTARVSTFERGTITFEGGRTKVVTK